MQDIVRIGKLVSSREHVLPGIRVKSVAERFFQEKKLDAVALVDCGEPVGLVTRNKLLFTLFRRYGFELYERKPILTIADTEPLVIHEGEGMDVTLEKAMDRPFQDIYDDIVVVDDKERYVGLLSVKGVVLEQSNAFANSIIQKEMASAKARELEKVNEMKSQFISNVTHELRAPVNAIIGLAELMRMSCDKGYIDQLQDRLSLLSSSAVSLRAIITNILDLSKVEAGKMEVFMEKTDVSDLLNEVVETTRILIGKKPVDVRLVMRESPPDIVTDRVKLRQVLINLLSNAAKFTDEGEIAVEAVRYAGHLVISVRDTGMGIRAEDVEKIFQAFAQVEDAKTKQHDGTGLGLTITRHLVGLLGGEVTLESGLGEGSTFSVRLPIKA